MQINLQLDIDLPKNTVTANDDLKYPLDLVLLKGDAICDSIRSNPDIVKEAELLKESNTNKIIKRLDGITEPEYKFTSKGQVNIVLDVDFEDDLLKVSGDSQGIYPLDNEMWIDDMFCDYNPIIIDAIKNNQDPVEKAILKITHPDYYKILYGFGTYTDDTP